MGNTTKPVFAGMGACEINPKVGLTLLGYPPRRENIGMGPMSLYARALVVGESADKPQAAVIVLDTIFVEPDFVERIRQTVSGKVSGLPAEAVMVCATHTHSAAALMSFRKPKEDEGLTVDPEYVEMVVEKSGEAAAAAWSAAVKVRLEFGHGSAHLHHNRRVVDAEGKATNEWLDTDNTHNGVTNPDVPFVLFREADGDKIVWVLGSYACHPVTMGPPNLKVSPDYPGGFVKAAKEAFGVAEAMFITGAGADINPKEALGDDHDVPIRVGKALADQVVANASSAAGFDAVPVKTVSHTLTLEMGPNVRERLIERATKAGDPKHIDAEVQAVRIGDMIIVSAPGELFTEIGQAMEKASPSPHTLVASYTNDVLSYLCTDKAIAEGGYEPKTTVSLNLEKPLVEAGRLACEKAYA